EINSTVQVTTHQVRLDSDNAIQLLGNSDVVIDASDNFLSRHCISAASKQLGIPHIWAAVLGYEAQMTVFYSGHGPVYEDLYPFPPKNQQSCVDAGVLGPVVAMAAAMMATETIKLLTGLGNPLIGTVAVYDFISGCWEYLPLEPSLSCTSKVCGD
ncbi:MAG: molybdopterin biosynthesis protein MoeB, partial [Chloroflexi bacterium]